MTGRILPAGSPLVQFEIQRSSDGWKSPTWPEVIWVDRSKRPAAGAKGCNCEVSYSVADPDFLGRFQAKTPGDAVVVCPCMGRFVE